MPATEEGGAAERGDANCLCHVHDPAPALPQEPTQGAIRPPAWSIRTKLKGDTTVVLEPLWHGRGCRQPPWPVAPAYLVIAWALVV